ncbi:MAG: hypothetical protein WDW38_009411 [Sanguina aurantia]
MVPSAWLAALGRGQGSQYSGAGHKGDQSKSNSGDGAGGMAPRRSLRSMEAEAGGGRGADTRNEIHTPTRSSFAGSDSVMAADSAAAAAGYSFGRRLGHDLALLTGSSEATSTAGNISPDTPYPLETSPASMAYNALNASPARTLSFRGEGSHTGSALAGVVPHQPFGLPPRGPAVGGNAGEVQAKRMYSVPAYKDDVGVAVRDSGLRRSRSAGLPLPSP